MARTANAPREQLISLAATLPDTSELKDSSIAPSWRANLTEVTNYGAFVIQTFAYYSRMDDKENAHEKTVRRYKLACTTKNTKKNTT